MNISLKKHNTTDADFVKGLYKDYKAHELKFPNPRDPFVEQILESQYKAQVKYYENFGDNYVQWIIYADSEKIGRFIEIREENNLHLADMIIKPEFRNRGIAKQILTETIDSAIKNYESITCNVDKNHTIITYYKKLGFEIIKDEGMEYLMALNYNKNINASS